MKKVFTLMLAMSAFSATAADKVKKDADTNVSKKDAKKDSKKDGKKSTESKLVTKLKADLKAAKTPAAKEAVIKAALSGSKGDTQLFADVVAVAAATKISTVNLVALVTSIAPKAAKETIVEAVAALASVRPKEEAAIASAVITSFPALKTEITEAAQDGAETPQLAGNEPSNTGTGQAAVVEETTPAAETPAPVVVPEVVEPVIEIPAEDDKINRSGDGT